MGLLAEAPPRPGPHRSSDPLVPPLPYRTPAQSCRGSAAGRTGLSSAGLAHLTGFEVSLRFSCGAPDSLQGHGFAHLLPVPSY